MHYLGLGSVGWANPLDWPLFYKFIDPLTSRAARVDDQNVKTLAQWFRHFEMPHLLAECGQHEANHHTPIAQMFQVTYAVGHTHPWNDAAFGTAFKKFKNI